MSETAVLNLCVDADAKRQAENILSELGVSMSTAVDIYLRQIATLGWLPFPVEADPVPDCMNADKMSPEEIRQELEEGYRDAMEGRTYDIDEVFSQILRDDRYEKI